MNADNPYYHRGPIKETQYFFNRARETAQALQMIRNRQSVSVIGPRRIGKTSFLFHLLDVTVRKTYGLDPERYSFAYLDAQALGGVSEADILRAMLEELAFQNQLPGIDIPPSLDYHAFGRILRHWIKSGQQLVYLIDEFEYLGNNPNLETEFFSFLRSLTVRCDVAYVTASKASLLDIVDDSGKLSSPFFNFFVPLQLGLFTEEAARYLIRDPAAAMGIIIPQVAEDDILALVGPHPFFLQIACFHAVELLEGDGYSFNEQTRAQWQETVQEELGPHYEYMISRLNEQERRTLVLLLDAGSVSIPHPILKLLERECLIERCGEAYSLISRSLAHFVRQRLGTTWASAIAEGDRRMATVLFVDVVGSTPLAGRTLPEEFFKIIQPAQRIFVDVIDRHGGKIANFGGDSVMALFGVPATQSDDAVRAVRAALEIQEQIGVYANELQASKKVNFAVRIGLDTGVVAIGKIGGEQRSEYTALGDTVNLAQRLEAQAQPGTVVISDHTYQQVIGRFKVSPLGLIEVKGKSQPVKAYQVLEERPQHE
jgi:class 3 adenylate cyclase